MSVSNVTGVGRVVLPSTAGRTSESPDRPVPSAPPASAGESAPAIYSIDEKTQEPIPPRFPWLSRLQRELEPASKQPSPYGTVPILGERLDKQA
jgi:hypothetical protein